MQNDVVKTNSSQSFSKPISTATRETIAPPVDVFENGEELLVAVDLPGVDPENVSLKFADNVLTLTGVRGEQHYERTLAIRTPIDGDKIHAESKNGTLNIHLPKAEKAKPRKIPVRLG